MPLHERYAELRNDNPKRGLDGRAAGPVEAAASVGDNPYALGDDTSSGTAALIVGRPSAIGASSPAAGTIRVNITADADATSYAIYRGATQIATTTTTGANVDTAGQPAGEHSVTVRARDEDGKEFATSAGTNVTVA